MGNTMTNLPLSVKNVMKSFGEKKVLKGINLEVKENEIVGLVGLNGIGKTTLIKIILDLLDCEEGSTEIFGINSKITKSRKNLSYLPEKFQPSHFLKGREFLSIFNEKEKKKLDVQKVCELADTLALERKALNTRVSDYSKGMTQKLGLIATFLSDANLIILDEPMSGLDPQVRIHLKDLLLKYKKHGKSIFFSSHILADIDEVCDRIAVLHNGKILFNGKPEVFKKKHSEKSLERAFLKEIGSL